MNGMPYVPRDRNRQPSLTAAERAERNRQIAPSAPYRMHS